MEFSDLDGVESLGILNTPAAWNTYVPDAKHRTPIKLYCILQDDRSISNRQRVVVNE